MLANNYKIGYFGETLAKQFLQKNNYKILYQNARFSNQEIDIIAKRNNQYFFVEVKTSSKETFFAPEDYISQTKLMNLKKAAARFCREEKVSLENIYFDFVAIKLKDNKRATIKHYKNIC